jgi:hypothetical protein
MAKRSAEPAVERASLDSARPLSLSTIPSSGNGPPLPLRGKGKAC